MEDYVNKYEQFEKSIVYYFIVGEGGIGDCIKFFMFALESCMKNNIRLYYKKNNIEIEKYIKLKYNNLYIDDDMIKNLDNITIVRPQTYYNTINYNFSINIEDVFYFSEEIKINCNSLMPPDISNYISIHLRLGDKYLETDNNFVCVKNDAREYSEEKIYKFIEENDSKNIFFCCDNNTYKLKLRKLWNEYLIISIFIRH
jgi:hypothetical protein